MVRTTFNDNYLRNFSRNSDLVKLIIKKMTNKNLLVKFSGSILQLSGKRLEIRPDNIEQMLNESSPFHSFI